MDQGRRTVELAASHEQQKNRILNEGLQRQIWLRNVTAGLAMLLGLPMILLLFLSRNREISRRMKTELELKELTGVLESRVATSTAGFERRSEEHTSELQSLMRISYPAFCLKNII